MTETNFPSYEIMLILSSGLGEEKTNSVLADLKELIKEANGEITHEDVWGLREFAYVIKNQKQGFYVVWNFTANPLKVKEFEKQLNINPSLVRYLIQKSPKYYETKTLVEYEEIAKAEEIKAKEEAKKKDDGRGGDSRGRRFEKPEPKPFRKEKPAKEEEKEEKKPVKKVKKEEPVEIEEEKPVEKPKKKQAATLEDVDAKLKSIIDDPDITL